MSRSDKVTVQICRKGDTIFPAWSGYGWGNRGDTYPATNEGLADLILDVQADELVTSEHVMAIEDMTIPPACDDPRTIVKGIRVVLS